MEDQLNESTSEEQHQHLDDEQTSRIVEYREDEDNVEHKPLMTELLLTLYELTKLDKELAEIDEERGDYPTIIENLSNLLKELNSKLSELEEKKNAYEKEVRELKYENLELEEKITKYDNMKYSARSNKEYDDITRSVDTFVARTIANEHRLKELGTLLSNLKSDIDELTKEISEKRSELNENKKILNDLNKQFESEENELLSRRKNIAQKIDPENLSLYERINSSYRGEGVAVVRKGNCSGCFNSLPPQREIEIRMAKRIFTCESCGRILIDETLVDK
ncbi:MAG: zinc ribbon domain-containing protein [Ignavibacteria bacterium]